MTTVQATCVAIDGRGVLLCGPSGCGKSDLALRLIDGGALLVGDDLVELRASGRQLVASLPERGQHLRGVMEVRGMGLMRVPSQLEVTVGLSVDLATSSERLPVSKSHSYAGIDVEALSLNAFEASAPARVRAALAYERVA